MDIYNTVVVKTSKEVAEALSFLISASGEYKFPQIMETITDQRNLIEECLLKSSSIENLTDKIASKFDIKKVFVIKLLCTLGSE